MNTALCPPVGKGLSSAVLFFGFVRAPSSEFDSALKFGNALCEAINGLLWRAFLPEVNLWVSPSVSPREDPLPSWGAFKGHQRASPHVVDISLPEFLHLLFGEGRFSEKKRKFAGFLGPIHSLGEQLTRQHGGVPGPRPLGSLGNHGAPRRKLGGC